MSNAPTANPGKTWGLIAGGLAIGTSFVIYAVNKETLFTIFYTCILFVIYTACAVLAGFQKRRYSEQLDFRGALKPVFTTYVIAVLIAAIFTYVLFKYLDPSLVPLQKTANIEYVKGLKKFYQATGGTEEEYLKAVKDAETQEYGVEIGGSFLLYLRSVIMYFIISVVISLILRKKK